MAELKQMSEDDIQGIVSDAVSEAVDFVESEITEDRIKAQRYFDGETDIGEEEGRSKIVATKVRDTVRAIKPSLMRVFLSSENPVEYVPTSQEDVAGADQATKYAHYRFQELNGYTLLNDAIHDALVKKTGVLKAYWEDNTEATIHTYSNLTEEGMSVIVNDENVTVIEQSTELEMSMDEFGMEVEMPKYELKISHKKESGKMMIESVPPEEFFVDRNARSVEDAYVVAHKTEMRVGDLVAMGYDFDVVSELSGNSVDDTFSDSEKFERSGYSEDDEEQSQDPSMKLVEVTEAYMNMDVYGTGQATMHRFILGGGNQELLDFEPWGEVPFAVFEIDPEPHTFYGRSIADLIMNDQDSSTAMLRGMMDNVALTNNPQIDVIEGQVNMDDVMNNEIGAIRRVKTQGAITVNAIPFVAGQTLGAMQYLDEEIQVKTGITKASMGLDPNALQNTTATAAQLTAQQGAGQVEVIARNLAEGGMKRLFKLMLNLLVENSCEETMMRLNGQYVPIDPRSWNTAMDVTVNVGLGTGKEENKIMALNQAYQIQSQIWQAYGPGNGLVTMTGMRNTLADILVASGVRNTDRYFNPMTPDIEAQLIAQKQQEQAQQPQTSPEAEALVQAETIKAQAKAQTDMMKLEIEAQKAIAEDDRKRDQMDQDLLVDSAKILGDHGTRVDLERIKQMQNTPRYPQQNPTQAVTGGRF
ncbi:MAG: hypothetical protein H8D23_41300 [Candidatus Brocadiales bacterium]|nr:hypothetical protein [Candidatus Brocadiales bacterium]